MTTYKIKTTSWVLWILTPLIIVPTGAQLLHVFIYPILPNASVVFVLIPMVLALYIERFISKGEVIIKLSENSISIEWIKQYISHNRPNIDIPFAEIENYKIQPDRNFDLFQVDHENGYEFRLWKSHILLDTIDDFDRLVKDFPSVANTFNRRNETNSSNDESHEKMEIKRAKTIFETNYAPLLAGFGILIVIVTPIILLTSHSKNSLGLLAAAGGASYFLFQFYIYRTKNKNST